MSRLRSFGRDLPLITALLLIGLAAITIWAREPARASLHDRAGALDIARLQPDAFGSDLGIVPSGAHGVLIDMTYGSDEDTGRAMARFTRQYGSISDFMSRYDLDVVMVDFPGGRCTVFVGAAEPACSPRSEPDVPAAARSSS
jgi:hypothetical protein